jgi:hypothetical protein
LNIRKRKISKKHGKKRYRIESLFGNIKNKANSVFKVKRWTILWNFCMILIYVFLFILSVLIFRRIFLIFGTVSVNSLLIFTAKSISFLPFQVHYHIHNKRLKIKRKLKK